MKLVYIKPEYRSTNEPRELYMVRSEPNSNGRVDIEPAFWEYRLPPVESVPEFMLEDAP